MITFKINIKLPSLNEYVKWCRGNKYAAAKRKRDIEDAIMWSVNTIPKISRPCVLHFTWYEQTKRRDKDNVAFAKKFILDALQKAGKLPNDNNRYVLGFSDDFVYKQGDGVLTEIEEINQ